MKMLDSNPEERPTAEQVLEDEFFNINKLQQQQPNEPPINT